MTSRPLGKARARRLLAKTLPAVLKTPIEGLGIIGAGMKGMTPTEYRRDLEDQRLNALAKHLRVRFDVKRAECYRNLCIALAREVMHGFDFVEPMTVSREALQILLSKAPPRMRGRPATHSTSIERGIVDHIGNIRNELSLAKGKRVSEAAAVSEALNRYYARTTGEPIAEYRLKEMTTLVYQRFCDAKKRTKAG